jgi:hypothetical protein
MRAPSFVALVSAIVGDHLPRHAKPDAAIVAPWCIRCHEPMKPTLKMDASEPDMYICTNFSCYYGLASLFE